MQDLAPRFHPSRRCPAGAIRLPAEASSCSPALATTGCVFVLQFRQVAQVYFIDSRTHVLSQFSRSATGQRLGEKLGDQGFESPLLHYIFRLSFPSLMI